MMLFIAFPRLLSALLQWIAVHLQQRIAKQQNHNQIVRYEYHYQFSLHFH